MKIKTRLHFLNSVKAKSLSKAKAKSLGWSLQNCAITKGDTVKVISGEARGRTGEVLSRSSHYAIVQGVNVRKKHVKGSQSQPGQILEIEKPIHLSNLVLAGERSSSGDKQ